MNDRELLELAAKAAGIEGLTWRNGSACFYYDDPETGREEWNPLCKDGQALRLAVKLNFTVRCYMGNTCVQSTVPGGPSVMVDDADTRRAITRAAAEIARAADAGGKEGNHD